MLGFTAVVETVEVAARIRSWRSVERGGLFPCYLPPQLWVSYRNPALVQLAICWWCCSAVCRERSVELHRREIPLHSGLGMMGILSKPLCRSGGSFQQSVRENHRQSSACITGTGDAGCLCSVPKQLRNFHCIWTWAGLGFFFYVNLTLGWTGSRGFSWPLSRYNIIISCAPVWWGSPALDLLDLNTK